METLEQYNAKNVELLDVIKTCTAQVEQAQKTFHEAGHTGTSTDFKIALSYLINIETSLLPRKERYQRRYGIKVE